MTIYGDEDVVEKIAQETRYIALYPEGSTHVDQHYLVGFLSHHKRAQSASDKGYIFELLEEPGDAYGYFWSLPDLRRYTLVYSPSQSEQYEIPGFFRIAGITIKEASPEVCTMVLQLDRVNGEDLVRRMKQKKVLNTPKSIQEALSAMFEYGKTPRSILQDAALDEDDSGDKEPVQPSDKADLKVKSPAPTPEKSSKKVPDVEEQELESGEIELKTIEDKLNSIRSGKSFKDSAVSAGMEAYFNRLDGAEKAALLGYLVAISQIVTGAIQGDEVIEPSDPPADVTMQKDGVGKKKVTVKPIINKGAVGGISSKKKGHEDTSGPVPIRPTKKL